MKKPKSSSSFGLGHILGLIFFLVGIVLFLNLIGFKLPIDLSSAEVGLQYGAAIGSTLGGLSMLFKKNSSSAPTLKIE